MRPLTFTQLFPNEVQPNFGVFVENRLRKLKESCEINPRVIAPVPWFPFKSARFGRYGMAARVPLHETRYEIPISHPRYPTLPKMGMNLQPWLLYRAMVPHIAELRASGAPIDLIDAHYVYPDGVAAALLARRFGLPLVMTARGTDLNLIPEFPTANRWIRWAIGEAQAMVGVCGALARRFIELGAPEDRVHVLRNGVDLEQFRPGDRKAIRKKLGFDGPTLLFVGQLIERKGVHLAIEALRDLPQHSLVVAGEGEELDALRELAGRLEVSARVQFLGSVAHERLPEFYTAADALVLPSSREGWANVLLESMACGTPVIATDIWGTPEVVACPEAGRLMAERSAKAIVEAWIDLESASPPRSATRAYAEQFSWEPTSRGQLELFRKVVAMGRS